MAEDKNKGGRPPHDPTPEMRAQVEALAGFGIQREEIARYLGISKPTLRNHYAEELAVGVTKANVQVARALHSQAVNGDVRAATFWLKTRGGWKETSKLEHTGEDGGPIEVSDAKAKLKQKLGGDEAS